jgi:predicted nuclease of predicted toxin-antitoxin system
VRFLIDNALSPKVARLLSAGGHDALHVNDYGLGAAADTEILERAFVEDRIVVSADSDFATLLALRSASKPSFILFREQGIVSAESYAEKILVHLPLIAESLESGCVVTFRRGKTRVRTLPLLALPAVD